MQGGGSGEAEQWCKATVNLINPTLPPAKLTRQLVRQRPQFNGPTTPAGSSGKRPPARFSAIFKIVHLNPMQIGHSIKTAALNGAAARLGPVRLKWPQTICVLWASPGRPSRMLFWQTLNAFANYKPALKSVIFEWCFISAPIYCLITNAGDFSRSW